MKCIACDDTYWVCENHADKPWRKASAGVERLRVRRRDAVRGLQCRQRAGANPRLYCHDRRQGATALRPGPGITHERNVELGTADNTRVWVSAILAPSKATRAILYPPVGMKTPAWSNSASINFRSRGSHIGLGLVWALHPRWTPP